MSETCLKIPTFIHSKGEEKKSYLKDYKWMPFTELIMQYIKGKN